MDSQYVGTPVYGGNGRMAETRREPLVNQKLMALGASIDLLEKMLEELDMKLTPVLSPSAPEPDGNAPVPQESVPLAEIMNRHIRRLEIIRNRVSSLTSRLEV